MKTELLFVSSLPLHTSFRPTTVISTTRSTRDVTPMRRARVRACTIPEEPIPEEGGTDASEASLTSDVPETPSTSGMTVSEAKVALYCELGVVDRGFSATQAQHERIISLISSLEEAALCESPLDDPLIYGSWELLYTNALDIISLSLLSPVASITSIYQDVKYKPSDTDSTAVDIEIVNVVNLQSVLSPVLNILPLPGDSLNSLDTRVEIIANGTPRDGRLMNLEISRGKVTQEKVPFIGTRIPDRLNSISWGVPPWNKILGDTVKDLATLETTFLDSDLRVARAGKTPLVANDGVFLLRRVGGVIE